MVENRSMKRAKQRAEGTDGSHDNIIAGSHDIPLRPGELERQPSYYHDDEAHKESSRRRKLAAFKRQRAEMTQEIEEYLKYEKVSHPNHYNWHPSGVECIAIVSEFNYNIGSAITYLWRAGRKPGSSIIEDIEKAIFHLDNEIERLQKDCDYEEAEGDQGC